jgi:NhaP-type Na+/H+ or K+/H+ antiporter
VDTEHSELIVGAVIVTVALSVLLHGVTAPWGANTYGAWYERQSEAVGEDESVG